MQLRPIALEQGRAGRLWRCLLVPHLKAGNSEAPGVVGGRHHPHQVGAVGDVLLVELDRDLVVACGREAKVSGPGSGNTNIGRGGSLCGGYTTGLLGDIGHGAGSVLAVVEGDLGPAGSLHGDGQTASPGLPGPDAELGWKNSTAGWCVSNFASPSTSACLAFFPHNVSFIYFVTFRLKFGNSLNVFIQHEKERPQ